jgi:hypothetical protein
LAFTAWLRPSGKSGQRDDPYSIVATVYGDLASADHGKLSVDKGLQTMKVDILDTSVFASFGPEEVQNYLTTCGWIMIRTDTEIVSIWEKEVTGQLFRVWMPLDVTLADYALSVGRLIRTVAQAEDRSQLQVMEDFGTIATGDVIRASTWDELDRSAGTVGLADGSLLLRRCCNMVRAAAAAVAEKRPVFPSHSTAQVQDYMHDLRLGQTEPGSYIIKIISPLKAGAPPVGVQSRMQLDDTPFARQAVISLVRSLDALEHATQDTNRLGKFYFEPYQEVVPDGVSANLCEAIAGSEDEGVFRQRLDVRVSWSYGLRSPADVPNRTFTFPRDQINFIAAAARAFRKYHPEDFSATGFVIMLEHQQKEAFGTIKLAGRIRNVPRMIRMILRPSDYDTAIAAHRAEREVTCVGRLTKQGSLYYLEDPRDFRMLPAPENSGTQLDLYDDEGIVT